MEKRDFFISYTKTDEAWAVWIAKALISHGYSVYVQALDIRPGDNFIKKMNDFLENSKGFIAVWSEGYSQSRFCMTELRAAFTAWHNKRMDCFLFVRIDNYPLEALYAALVYVNLSDKDAESEKTLIDAVRSAIVASGKELNDVDNEKVNEDSDNSDESNDESENDSQTSALERVYYTLGILLMVVLLLWFGITTYRQWKLDNVGEILELSADELYQAGYNYQYGENGVEINYAKAIAYYEQAAEKGSDKALVLLGYLYDNSLKNYQKAMDYYEQAAGKGNAVALNNLGTLYQNGLGVDVDYDKAIEFYEQAAEKGNSTALHNLGWTYENAVGVEVDYAKALEYYQKALDAGYKNAAEDIAALREKMNS